MCIRDRPYTLCDMMLIEIKGLNTKRAQLVRIKAQLIQTKDDNTKFQSKDLLKKITKIDNPIVKALDDAIEKIEADILALIKSNTDVYKRQVSLNLNMTLACSVNSLSSFQ